MNVQIFLNEVISHFLSIQFDSCCRYLPKLFFPLQTFFLLCSLKNFNCYFGITFHLTFFTTRNLVLLLEVFLKIFLVEQKNVFSYLFDEVDGRLQVESEIDEFPFDSFSLIFLLLQDEHLKTKRERKMFKKLEIKKSYLEMRSKQLEIDIVIIFS